MDLAIVPLILSLYLYLYLYLSLYLYTNRGDISIHPINQPTLLTHPPNPPINTPYHPSYHQVKAIVDEAYKRTLLTHPPNPPINTPYHPSYHQVKAIVDEAYKRTLLTHPPNPPINTPYHPSYHQVKAIVDEAYKRTLLLVEERREQIRMVAEMLLEKETITNTDVAQLIGKRPYGSNKEYEVGYSHFPLIPFPSTSIFL